MYTVGTEQNSLSDMYVARALAEVAVVGCVWFAVDVLLSFSFF